MVLLASIPQDVVEEILDHLHGDITTLKSCSTVAVRFHLPSRKLLFSCVVLDTPRSLTNLHALLDDSPDIATLIHILHLRTFFPTDDMGAILLSVSRRLQHLQHLTLGCNKGLSWSRFSKSNITALETLVGSENLQSLKISHVYAIPLLFFRTARGIRKLTMELVYIENDKSAKDSVHFAKLEALSLGSSVLFEKAASIIVPKLRRVSVHGPHPSSLESAIQFISSTSSVIEDFSWGDFYFESIPLNNSVFRFLSGLRRLSFEISKFRAMMAVTWSSIINVLDDSPAAQSVETLTFLIRQGPIVAPTTGFSFRPGWLRELDVLADKARFPKLARVEFIVEHLTYNADIAQDITRSVLEDGLLKLHEAGTPAVHLCIDSRWYVCGREERRRLDLIKNSGET